MTHTDLRPLAHARKAAEEMLESRVADGSLSPLAAQGMLSASFALATQTIADLRVKEGMSEQAITDAFQARLDKAEDDGDPRRALVAEFTLAVWGGMQADLAAWLGSDRGQR